MSNLISPGVDVRILHEDFYVSGSATTVPLIFVCTGDEKLQTDGVTPALGTYESNVLRTVTSNKQLLELYGVPSFRTSSDGQPHHGDARNEYGLDAAAKALGINRRVYVIRANVNLNDDLVSIKALWNKKIAEASDYLNSLVTEYIVQYNDLNGFLPADVGYKTTVDKATMKTLVQEALTDVLGSYSFSKDAFEVAFLEDHSIAHAAYQDVVFDSFAGYVTGADITGLTADVNYGAQVKVVAASRTVSGVVGTSAAASAIVTVANATGLVQGMTVVVATGTLTLTSATVLSVVGTTVTLSTVFGGTGTSVTLDFTFDGTAIRNLYFTGAEVPTFATLATKISTVLGLEGSAAIVQGRLRITSTLSGATSEVEILVDGPTGHQPLFASTNLFNRISAKVLGTGVLSLDVYDATYSTILGGYGGLYSLITGWSTGVTLATEFSASEAEGLLLSAAATFDNTKQFKTLTSLGLNDAQRRAEIVKALQAAVNNPYSNARSEALEYNIVIAPGYPELAGELVTLGQEMHEEIFIIGSTPMDKPPTGPNSITNWAVGNGRVTNDSVAYWYGHGITSNIDGASILSTACTSALRTLIYSDANSEGEWIAPAGPTRGVCPQIEDLGYVSGALGGPTTFVRDWLDDGTRDELYEFPKSINPITFIPGRGFLVMGQKTASPLLQATDRINVARLVKYIKRQLRKALFSYLFEPNDDITRRNVKASTDSFLSTLIDRRALYDFASICDEDNNSGQTIDNNELYIDVAIKPVKAVEFIYARVRIVRTNANIGTNRNIGG
jgi:hypothetical protein